MHFYCEVRVVELLLLSENMDTTSEIVSTNVAFAQANIFIGLFAIFAGPLEGDGVSRDGAASIGVSISLSLLGEHVWDEDVDWSFR